MAGGAITSYLNKQPDGPGLGGATRFYLASIVLGLEALHEQRICYRDLKASNVLLDARGQARLSDFGLSVDVSKELATGTHGTKDTWLRSSTSPARTPMAGGRATARAPTCGRLGRSRIIGLLVPSRSSPSGSVTARRRLRRSRQRLSGS